MAEVEEGAPAPDFTLTSDSGDAVTLSSLRGQPIVLFFYPKDDTPGCTAQACGIRDAYGEFEDSGAIVLGVSPDGEASHAKFKEKYELPFTLLADADHAVARLRYFIPCSCKAPKWLRDNQPRIIGKLVKHRVVRILSSQRCRFGRIKQ
jgi:peroxiredoxin